MDKLSAFFENIDWDLVINTSIKTAVVLGITLAASIVLNGVMRRVERQLIQRGVKEGEPLSESRKRAQTLMGLVRQSLIIAMWIAAGLVVLGQVGVEIGPILAGAGILGVALGFGAQSLVRDFFSGFFLIMENQVRVGDVARVNGTAGIVEDITFRILVLRDLQGEVHIFPNGTVTTLSNLTAEWSAYVFELGVAYKEDTDRVTEVIRTVLDSMQQDPEFGRYFVDRPEIFGVDEFADSAVVIKGRVKTQPLRQWEIKREFLRRIKRAFDESGIEIPFPHRSLYFGEASNPFAVLQGQQDQAPGSAA